MLAPTFESFDKGWVAQLPGTFAGLAVKAKVVLYSLDTAAGAASDASQRVQVMLSATNVNLKLALTNLWSGAPAFVLDALDKANFDALSASMLSKGACRMLPPTDVPSA